MSRQVIGWIAVFAVVGMAVLLAQKHLGAALGELVVGFIIIGLLCRAPAIVDHFFVSGVGF